MQKSFCLVGPIYLKFYMRFEGGTKWSGKILGNSLPSNLTLIKCIAKANSSTSRKPSQSTSDNFQILLNTEFGSFDFINSILAAERKIWIKNQNSIIQMKNSPAPEIFPSTGFNASKIGSVRGRSLLHIQSGSPKPAWTPSPLL